MKIVVEAIEAIMRIMLVSCTHAAAQMGFVIGSLVLDRWGLDAELTAEPSLAGDRRPAT